MAVQNSYIPTQVAHTEYDVAFVRSVDGLYVCKINPRYNGPGYNELDLADKVM
jgi:hypothetical protein